MLNARTLLATLAAVALGACESPNGLAPSSAPTTRSPLSLDQSADPNAPASATGGGHYNLAGLDVQFALSAVQQPNGTASGQRDTQPPAEPVWNRAPTRQPGMLQACELR
jgi:hypothetical protein